MACVSEAIGLALPNSAGAPAPYESRDVYAEESGRMVMDLIARQIRPRDIITREALENAAVVVAASGGSTNAGLHLPAIANEAGIDFDLHDVCEIFRRTPYIADMKPGGRYVAKDMYDIGGVPVLMKALLDGGYLHGDCLTVSGRTIAENLAEVAFPADQDVFRESDDVAAIVSGDAEERHFRVEGGADALWIVPGSRARVHREAVWTTALKCGPGADADCVSWETAPLSGYSSDPVALAPGYTYMLRVPGDDGEVHFGAVRPSIAGFDQDGDELVVFDWAYQPLAGNPSLDRAGR